MTSCPGQDRSLPEDGDDSTAGRGSSASPVPPPVVPLTPFEWLTSPSSLEPYLLQSLRGAGSVDDREGEDAFRVRYNGRAVLHVGSGTSVLGEYLLEREEIFCVDEVLNVDCDRETLKAMEERWLRRIESGELTACSADESVPVPPSRRECLQFRSVDFRWRKASPAIEQETPDQAPDLPLADYPDGYFDMAVDKSTLDCTLCSCDDGATSGMLALLYRLLNPRGGVYVVVSFHHINFLLSILDDPGLFDWDVSHTVVQRDTVGGHPEYSSHVVETAATSATTTCTGTAWSKTGSFEPDESYRKNVSVVFCRRKIQSGSGESSNKSASSHRDAIQKHIQDCVKRWYQEENPMLTELRKHKLFGDFERSAGFVPLEEAYTMIFDDTERVHYTYDLFLEDWISFASDGNAHGKNDRLHGGMSFNTAVRFLEEMQ